VALAAPPADTSRVFVVEREGDIEVIRNGRRLSRSFVDLERFVGVDGAERGLLALAFDPNYARNRLFYVYFTGNTGDIHIWALRRSRRNPNRADPDTRRRVLNMRHRRFANHNGGQLQFGPDGLLYASPGDGGGGGDPFGNGQNLGTLLGKVIRINPHRTSRRRYTVPASNPFVGRPGARREIWAYGLRNPYRFSFDRLTGDIIIGDVGQNAWEEVDFSPNSSGRGRGVNYGWNRFEGDHLFSPGTPLNPAGPYVPPVIEHSHETGVCSVIGGYVVRDPGLPTLAGRYVYGDFCRGDLRSAILAPGGATDNRPVDITVNGLSSFGEDARGRIYVTSLTSGRVARLVAP
jgi:hypothetical protein